MCRKGNGAVLVAALECSHRIVVSTQDFHSCNTSSILVGSTNKDYVSLVVSIFVAVMTELTRVRYVVIICLTQI